MSNIRIRAETKVAERLASLKGHSIFRNSHEAYTKLPELNLIPGIEKMDFWSDLGAGAGNELTDDTKGPAKFCAAYSSSALAVNSFGPFRHKPEMLGLLSYKGFCDAQFEKPLPTGLRGTDPHLDFYVSGNSHVVCIESKFLEPLSPKLAKFADSYEGAIATLAESAWGDVYEGLKTNSRQFKYLDVAQLVKHYLGMRNTLGELETKLILLYVYWEPINADSLEPYNQHREEITQLSEMVQNSQITFVARSYNQLWSEWKSTSTWSGMHQHIVNLETRYSMSI